MKNKKYSTFIEYVGITVGCALMAVGIVFFLQPNTIAPGGVTGIGVVVQKLIGVPIDVTNLVINIPLFISGVILLGGAFGMKTAYATVMLSGFIRFFIIMSGDSHVVTNDLLLSAIYGGVIMGAGIGLVFRSGGTTGGTDLAGAILNKYFPNLSIAKLMMILDLMVVVAAGLVVKNVEISLYSIIALYILVQMADFIVEGLSYSKAFYIISNHSDKIGKKINSELDRGVTALQGRGFYTGAEKDVLLCVVNRAQVAKLKKLVYEIDEKAFIMVTTIHEVLGEGFKEVKK
ncbi:YitT family protein [Alkaliphilus sp. MSJ-5]|uniref:YitT family protein n=1 Tax=Alkaliphilus flagellatus TaxID=2841507 RepID=A0ABS6G031_9FIRM|nr:YitT family protein [Alkaliphilus flagellatus]MBU5674983.1 YitT family protein [Alkaliphilus flagellatus]